MIKMIKKMAYKMVLKDLCECNMFIGKHDAKNGNEHFMYGIGTVMECIAYRIDEKTGDDFADTFMKNVIESIDKVKGE